MKPTTLLNSAMKYRILCGAISAALLSADASAQNCGSYGNPCYIRQSPGSGNLSNAIVNGARIGEMMRESRRRDEELRMQQEQLVTMRSMQRQAAEREAYIRQLEQQNRVQDAPPQQIDTATDRERAQAASYWTSVYPAFDPNSSSFNQELTQEAVALRDHYEDQGEIPAKAIERAVRVIAAAHGLRPRRTTDQVRTSTVSDP